MLKVMTLNLNGHGTKHGPWSMRRGLIAQAIRDAGPHLVALQAVEKDPAYSALDQAAQLAELTPGYDSHFVAGRTASSGKVEGMAFLSTLDLAGTGVFRLSPGPRPEDRAPRLIQHACLRLRSGNLWVFNGHFSWVERQNLANIEEAMPYLSSFRGKALLAGDFNTEPRTSMPLRLETEGWTDLWAALRPLEDGLTFESSRPSMRIDYIWANPLLREDAMGIEIVKGRGHPGARLSDHLGVCASLASDL